MAAAIGCREEPAAPPPVPSAERALPVEPGAPLDLAKPDEARVTIDLAAVRTAVKRAQQIEGRTPATLEEVGVRVAYPADMDYDPKTGRVRSHTYPAL